MNHFGLLTGIAVLGMLAIICNFVSGTIAQAPPTSGSVSYRYDSLGRIAQDIYPSSSAAYSYDSVGNRMVATQN